MVRSSYWWYLYIDSQYAVMCDRTISFNVVWQNIWFQPQSSQGLPDHKHKTSPVFIYVILLCIQQQIQVQMCDAAHLKESFPCN